MNTAVSWEDRLFAAFTDPATEPWLPCLTADLVELAERRLLKPIGLSLDTYGTDRYISRSIHAERNEVHRLPTTTGRSIHIEHLNKSAFARYVDTGLCQLPADEILARRASRILGHALAYLDAVPSLRESVELLVRSIHVLSSRDDAIDISHSDPELPFSIFVSLPATSLSNAVLRVAESIVHEAMHLQLTLIENLSPLVSHSEPILTSPWRSEPRPPAGLLHGIYVFSVVASLYQRLSMSPQPPDALRFFDHRRTQIGDELSCALVALKRHALTPPGVSLIELLGKHHPRDGLIDSESEKIQS